MRLFNTNGKLVYKNVNKKKINWLGKSRSKLQKSVKLFLKEHWENHIVYEEFPVYGTRLSVDILNATKKIAIEVNGRQHDDYVKFFHGSRNGYLQSIKRDVKKAQWLELNKFTLIEITREDAEQLSLDYIKETFGISIV
tara:strand:- start:11 stop:427 length:417 start_codon:yes stop_codon:yes gene_type:complete